MYIWDQHEFVSGCMNWYKQADLQPGNPEDGCWHKAHYPVPKCLGGTEWIWLLKEHHAIQGVLQSMEYNHCCMSGWEKQYLTGQWEYLLSGFIHICGKRGSENLKRMHSTKDEYGRSLLGLQQSELLNQEKDELGRSVNAVKGGLASRNNSNSALCRTPEQMTEDGKRGGLITKENGLGIFAPGQQQAGGNAVSKQRWQCTVTGKVSAAGPLTGYQKARGIDPANRVRRYDLEVR
jgi:hypothetical protein